jgi:hypothetical protein
MLAIRWNYCSPCLFHGVSAAARVEYMLVVLTDVVATAEKRGEGGSLVCPSVAQMTISMTSTQGLTLSGLGSEPDRVQLFYRSFLERL